MQKQNKSMINEKVKMKCHKRGGKNPAGTTQQEFNIEQSITLLISQVSL